MLSALQEEFLQQRHDGMFQQVVVIYTHQVMPGNTDI